MFFTLLMFIFNNFQFLFFLEGSLYSLPVTKLSIIIIAINNFRIGSTYALILEAFKLGS